MDFIDGVFYSRSKRDIARIVPQILAGAEGQYFFYSRSKRDIARIVPQILAGAEGQYFPRVQNPIWGVLFEGAASIKQGQYID